MPGIRLLIGTAKGAFIGTSDEARQHWDVSEPLFGGMEVLHIKASPADPNRMYASAWTDWHGQIVHRSDDGGSTWDVVDNNFAYEGKVETHSWYDGTPHDWTFKRVWHLEPARSDPDTVFAGVEDAALFRSTDGGRSWHELAGLRHHESASHWAPGAGGLCLHTILVDPRNANRIFVAMSAVGAFRSDDGGASWVPINKGLHSDYLPDPTAEIGHCVHRLAMHPDRPDVLFMQKHWHVMRSDDAGEEWYKISDNLPSDFGFAIDVHAHDPDIVYVVPVTSDAQHYTPEGKLRVFRSQSGKGGWEALTQGLPQENCYTNVLRDAMTVDTLDPCGIYFGTTSGGVFASPDAGEHWHPVAEHLPRVLSVEAHLVP